MSEINIEDLHAEYVKLFSVSTDTVGIQCIVHDLFHREKLNQIQSNISDRWTESEAKEHKELFNQTVNTVIDMLSLTTHLFILKYEEEGKVCMSDALEKVLVNLSKALCASLVPLIREFEEQLEEHMSVDQFNRTFTRYCLSACTTVTRVCKSQIVNG